MRAVAETSIFSRRADALLTGDEQDELIATLAARPLSGDQMPGLGGVRKLRFAAGGRGKSGGLRVIYWVGPDDLPVLALILYGKGERADLSPAQREAVARAVSGFRSGAWRRPAVRGDA